MTNKSSPTIRQLLASDIKEMRKLLAVFGEAFDETDTYTANQPGDGYLREILGADSFIALAAVQAGTVIGGLAAYELRKFEAERSEIYIYDLAVSAGHRRQGIATDLIERLRAIAAQRGVHVIFVQADRSDAPAVELYTKLGTREEVLHFDIDVT